MVDTDVLQAPVQRSIKATLLILESDGTQAMSWRRGYEAQGLTRWCLTSRT